MPRANRVTYKSSRFMDVQLHHDAGAVGLSGLDADVQQPGDLFGALAFRNQLQHLALPTAERLGADIDLILVCLDDSLGNFGTQVGAAPRGLANRMHEVFRRVGLHDEPLGTGLQSLQDIMVLGVHGQNDRFRVLRNFLNFSGGFEAIQDGHGDIQHGHVRLKLLRQLDRLLPVRSFGDHVKAFPLEEHFQTLAHHHMIIGQ